jgi:hypothetical protein
MGCDEPDPGVVGDELTLRLDGPQLVAVGTTGTYLAVVRGPVEELQLHFGDGTTLTNFVGFSVEKAWTDPGVYDTVLWARSQIEPLGISCTQVVHVVSLDSSAIHVAPGGSDANTGTNWLMPKATVQAGVDAQQVLGGLVLLSNGTYNLSSQVFVDKDIVITSLGGPEATIVDGGGVTRCFLLTNCNATIHGLTISNAFSDAEGGGMFCISGAPIVADCTFVDNHSVEGGAIRFGWVYSCCGSPLPKLLGVARDCRFLDNFAAGVGGVSNGNMYRCLFAGNRATGGAGGFGYGSATACVFSNNVCDTRDGGGMTSGDAYDCLFIENRANRGGACSYANAYNCTAIENHALEEGGGFFHGEVVNSIVWSNTAGSAGYNFSGTAVRYTSSPDLTHGVDGNLTNSPGFISANDYRLGPGSACIDAGSDVDVMTGIDLAGKPRIVGDSVDMGAFEHAYGANIEGLPVPIPELWMVQHGFSGDLVVAAWADQDFDGSATWAEYVAGTHPTEGSSVLHVDALIVSTSETALISWQPSVSGRTYRVLSGPSPLIAQSTVAIAPYPASAVTTAVEFVTSAVFAVEAMMETVP